MMDTSNYMLFIAILSNSCWLKLTCGTLLNETTSNTYNITNRTDNISATSSEDGFELYIPTKRVPFPLDRNGISGLASFSDDKDGSGESGSGVPTSTSEDDTEQGEDEDGGMIDEDMLTKSLLNDTGQDTDLTSSSGDLPSPTSKVIPVTQAGIDALKREENDSEVKLRAQIDKLSAIMKIETWSPPPPQELTNLFLKEVTVVVKKTQVDSPIAQWILQNDLEMDKIMGDMIRVLLFLRNFTRGGNDTMNETSYEFTQSNTRELFIGEMRSYIRAVLYNAAVNDKYLKPFVPINPEVDGVLRKKNKTEGAFKSIEHSGEGENEGGDTESSGESEISGSGSGFGESPVDPRKTWSSPWSRKKTLRTNPPDIGEHKERPLSKIQNATITPSVVVDEPKNAATSFQLTLGIFSGMVIGIVLTVACVVILVCCARKQTKLKTFILTEETKVKSDFV